MLPLHGDTQDAAAADGHIPRGIQGKTSEDRDINKEIISIRKMRATYKKLKKFSSRFLLATELWRLRCYDSACSIVNVSKT